MTSPVLVATDLDRTVIYSAGAAVLGAPAGLDLVAVEVYQGRDASFMTSTAAGVLAELARAATLVPVTTRTPAQLDRVTLPGGPSPFAVAANGGFLYVDGRPDADWTAGVRAVLATGTPLGEVWDHLAQVCRPEWTQTLRNAEDLFCYAVIDRAALPAGFLAEVTAWADARGWSTSLQGRKLYWLPRPLTKSAAVREIARRTGASTILAAGDSLLDIDLLETADRGIHPAHGEIAESGWTAPHVVSTATVGAVAGEDICRWFAAQLTATADTSAPGQSVPASATRVY